MNLANYVNLLRNNLLLEFHDSAFLETDFDCYYLLKALKLVNYELFMQVAQASITSTHGSKAAFHKVVAKYDAWGFNCSHPENEGGKLLSLITDYFKVNGINNL